MATFHESFGYVELGTSGEETCGLTKGYAQLGPAQEVEKVDGCKGVESVIALGKGTSGAPVYKRGIAYGLVVGAKGTCDFYYEPINKAESALHVEVLGKYAGP